MRLSTFALGAWRLRVPLVLLTAVAGASLALGPGVFWAGDLASLSPVPPAQQELDRSLRQDMRMPDTATLIVLQKPDQEAALAAAERITAALVPVMERGGIAGIDSPARYLPSVRVQRLRQAALPSRNVLQMSLDAALDGLPFRAEYFAPFVADVDRQRSMEPISRTDLDGTAVSQQVDSLLLNRAGGVVATVGLRGVTAASAIATSVAGEPNAVLVNLKAESDRLLRMYLSEGATLAGLGAGAIGLLLLVSLRSWRRIAIVAAPLMAAVVVTLAILRLGGHALSVFNLFGMLLVVAIGSNYCLFLDRMRTDPAGAPRVLASLLFANACTVTGFGVLAISDTPVLHDLGLPVAAGTFLSLVFAVIIMAPPDADPDAIAG
jgi:predicted exporter